MNVLTRVFSSNRESVAHDSARRLKTEFEKIAIPEISRLYAAAFFLPKTKRTPKIWFRRLIYGPSASLSDSNRELIAALGSCPS